MMLGKFLPLTFAQFISLRPVTLFVRIESRACGVPDAIVASGLFAASDPIDDGTSAALLFHLVQVDTGRG